jgi:hypothetical protein
VYRGPQEPELLIITCGSGWMYCLDAVVNLDVNERVGILKSPTTPVGRGMMKPPRRGQTTSGTRSTELIL